MRTKKRMFHFLLAPTSDMEILEPGMVMYSPGTQEAEAEDSRFQNTLGFIV